MTAIGPLEIEHVSKSFGGVRALHDVNLTIDGTGITALIGPNGAGKTTLFNVISGFGVPYSGTVRFDGQDLTGLPAHKVARFGLVRTFQTPVGFPTMTVAENVAFASAGYQLDTPWSPFVWWRKDRAQRRHAAEVAAERLAAAGIAELADRALPDLSPGDAKLVEIVRQMTLQPRMLLLDEPAAAMTVNQVHSLAEIIRGVAAGGVGVVVIDHNLGFVLDLAARVHVLENGEVISSGSPDEIKGDGRVREIYLGGTEHGDVA